MKHCQTPGCQGRPKVTHSIRVEGGSTQRGECPECLKTYTIVSFVAFEDPGRGQGASAVARKIAEGELIPELRRPE